MIETNILDWIDLGTKLETLEIFKNKKNVYLFRFFSNLRKFEKHGILFHLVLKILFFLQIMCLDSFFLEKTDYFTNIFSILRPYVFFVEVVNNKNSYVIAFTLSCILVWSIVILSTIIFIQLSNRITSINFPYVLLNLSNTFLKEILIGPLIWILLSVFKCVNGSHIHLQTACYSSSDHLAILIFSMVNLIFLIAIIYFISIFSNDCGSIKDIRILNSLNCHYEIVSSIVKLSIFIFAFIVKNYETNSNRLKIIFCLYVFIVCFLISYYTYKHVLFYNEILNKTILYGWCVTTWYSLLIFFKTILQINDILIIFITGLLIIFLIMEHLQIRCIELLLMKDHSNTNYQKSLKEIELFKIHMLNLLNQNTDNQKAILLGITRIYKENINKNQDIEEKFKRLLQNEHLKQKFNNEKSLEILAQIFMEYHNHLEKSTEKNEILINLCYFLINSMKNFTYVSYLISKSKALTLKQKYQKFILIEEIKEFMLIKLNNSQNTNRSDYIKNVQISSVILFESYCDILRAKINQTIYQRVDYFELMTTRIGVGNSNLSLKNFLDLSDKILDKTRDILKISSLIRDMNPFDEDIFNNYHYYLDIINKDYKLALEERKKLNEIRLARMSERGNIYFSLFETNSNIILVDGFNNKSQIIYANKNFYTNFKTNQNELLSKTIHDLVPTAIKDFHEEIIDNGIKYSNLSYVFNKQRMLLLKNSKGNLHNVKIYIKSIPNLKHGLIYIVSIIKIEDQSGIIVLDSDMNVDGLTDFFSQEMIDLYINRSRRHVEHSLNAFSDRHISMIIPETANHIRYNSKTGKFYFANETSEYKGTICNVEKSEMIVNLLKELMEMVKQISLIEYEFAKNPKNLEKTENFKAVDGRILSKGTSQNYKETLTTFINAVKENSKRAFKVFYKINTKSFIGNKYQYHKIFLHKDLSGSGDDFSNEKLKTQASLSSNLNQNNNLNCLVQSQHEIKLNIANRAKLSLSNNFENMNIDNLLDSKLRNVENVAENKQNQNSALEREKKNLSMSRSTKFSSTSTELATLSSIKILLKTREISIFRHMKNLALLYAAATLFFYIYFYEANTFEKYNTLNSNLLQSKFFNNSKLVVSQIYYYTLNTKMYINNFYQDENCYNSNCQEFYKNQIDESISLLNELNTNCTFFNQQFRDILYNEKQIELEISLRNVKEINSKDYLKKIEKVTLSYKNLIDLIISYSLNLKKFLSTSNSDFDSNSLLNKNEEMTIENILKQSHSYLTNTEIFINSNTIDTMSILQDYSRLFMILTILKIFLNVLIMALFFYFSYSIYNLENTHVSILIKFKNPNFMEYMKFLSDEWKKVSNNYELEMQKNEEQENLESNQANSINAKNKKDKSNEVENRNLIKNESLSIVARDNPDKNAIKTSSTVSQKKVKNGKKMALKKKKKSEEIENKIYAIKSYFARFHTFLFLKVFGIILISLSYLAIITFIDKQKVLQIRQLDSKLDQLYNIYLQSNSIYFEVKSNLAMVVSKEIQKNKAITNYIKNNPNGNKPIEFDGVVYDSVKDLKKSITYKLEFPTTTVNSQMVALFDLITKDQENLDLSNLYFGNACEILYGNNNDPRLKTYCENFWFGVLTKGFEQSLTKLNSIYSGIGEELKYANLDEVNLKLLFTPDSNIQLYQDFMEIFFFDSFVKTNELFFTIKGKIPREIDSLYVKILVLYVILLIILTFLNVSIILIAKKSFNSLINFIYIIPAEFIVADANLYSEVLKLEKIF